MLRRNLGVLVALLGAVLAGFAVLGLFNAREMSTLVGMTGNPADSATEASRWLRHWYLSAAVMLCSGFGLAVSGVGLFLRRRWSVLVLAVLAVLLALQDVILWLGGWARYAFEEPEPAEIVLLLLVAGASILAFRRWHPARPS